MAPNKQQFLEKLEPFFNKINRFRIGLLRTRKYIEDTFASVCDNTLTRVFAWALSFLFIIFIVICFLNYSNSNPVSLYIKICFGFIVGLLYLILILLFGGFLKESLYSLIVPKDSDHDPETNKNAHILTVGITLCMTVMVVLLIFDYFQHSKVNSVGQPVATEYQNSPSKHDTAPQKQESPTTEIPVFLGTYGDFFGGVVNPVLTFGTLIALAITVLMQRLQLRDARSENKKNSLHAQKQAFESTFFNLLTLHTENVKNLRFDEDDSSGKKAAEGRTVFALVLHDLAKDGEDADSRLAHYLTLQKDQNDILGHYFRHLYQILNHIDKFEASMTSDETYMFQKRYANILRAQLSSHELVLLVFNCTEGMVDKGRFRKLVVRYEFLEHLPATLGENGVPCVSELGPSAEKLFLHYFPDFGESSRNPYGAFGKNEIFIDYIKVQQAEAKKIAKAKLDAARAARDATPASPVDSPGPVVD